MLFKFIIFIKCDFMKKVFISFAFVAILFACSFERGEAQPCQSGYTQTFGSFTYINGSSTCTFIVNYCFKCAPTFNSMDVIINWFEPQNSGCYQVLKDNFNDIKNASKTYLLSVVPYLCTTPPCNQTPMSVQIIYPMCYKFYLDNGNKLFAIACDYESICKISYNACDDYNYTPPRLVITNYSATLFGTDPPNCSTTVPNVPTVPGSYSSCFRASCE